VNAAETVVVQAAPFALGAAVAAQVFRPDDDGGRDGPDPGSGPPRSSTWETARDLGASATGALFFAMAIAPTEEIPMIAASLSPAEAAVLVVLSLVATYLIVFVAGFADQEARRTQVGALQHPLTETVAAYVTTLVVALCMLWVFDNLTGDPLTVLVETVVLGLPAGVGGAAGRVIV
jgi:putative integral membrane protein (TIGR02587 family)